MMQREVPLIRVACAIIEGINGTILSAQRGEGGCLGLKWEFPGGKIHNGESPSECLVREIQEEMGTEIAIRKALPVHRHTYETFSVELHPFVCWIRGGEMILHEHKAVRWGEPNDLLPLDWADADIPVLHAYMSDQRKE
jgi:8-oxo-dGTP diphosphatase